VYTVAPSLVMVGIWVKRLGALPVWRWGLALLISLAALWPPRDSLRPLPPFTPRVQPGFERAGGRVVAVAEPRRQVLQFIAEHTRSPQDPIYLGTTDHSFVYWSEMDLYFFANRVGATRYMQFDPNIINRLDVQQRMAQEIAASGTRVVVLSSFPGRSFEPNDSAKQGANYLDQYLRERFTVVRRVPPYYVLMLRRD
jgi:hypothetical protein